MKKFRIVILLLLVFVNSCSKEDEIKSLNELVDSLQNKIAQLNSEINDYSNQITQLISQNNVFTVQIEGLNNQLTGLQNNIQNYIDEIQVLTESNELLQSENNALTNQLTDLQDQLYDIQSQSAESGIYIFNQINLTDPPFGGTMWDLPDLITSSDYTVYSSSVYQGVETRLFYDKAIPDFVNYPAHIFKVNFGDGLSVDFEIYSEFSEQEAISIEQKYAPLLGQLGKELRKNIKSIEFLKGDFVASAQRSTDLSYANITFHIDWLNNSVETRPDGDKTEELLIHESAHLSIDPYVYDQQGWIDAVSLDNNYISTYAKDNPDSEDVAETFQAYIAVKYFPERISNSLRDTILSVCLNRFKYFDSLNFDLSIYK
tara:strand:- start:59 stop:1177 length:1119 start_codon:yes stop_codon:yes gene_type:complete